METRTRRGTDLVRGVIYRRSKVKRGVSLETIYGGEVSREGPRGSEKIKEWDTIGVVFDFNRKKKK